MENPQEPIEEKDDKLKKYSKEGNSYVKYMGAGIQLIAPVLLGALVGYWIDNSQHSAKPIWTITLSSIMIVVALYLFIKQFLKP